MSYALITGASKGIGKAIATELARRKINLLLVARSENLLEAAAVELRAKFGVEVLYCSVDLSAIGAAKKVYDWTQQSGHEINILVNNAGYGLAGNFEKYPLEAQNAMMQINMNTPMELVHLFLPQLKAKPQSYILNIASTTAYQALPLLSVYAGAKAFILSFSRGLRYELRKTNVSVTCVSPGSTDTDFPNRADVGAKALKNAQKVNMSPESVAQIAVASMFAKKTEVIAGFINKLGAFMAWLLPKKIVEKTAAGFYE